MNARQKRDVNSDPRSDTILVGIPCLEKTWVTYNWASSSAVRLVVVGIKRAILFGNKGRKNQYSD